MKITKNALGNLKNRYKAVLKKCNLINVFGSLALATSLTLPNFGIVSENDISLFSLGVNSAYASAYTAVDITNNISSASDYYTTYTVQEADTNGNVTSKTYGILLNAKSNTSVNSVDNLITNYINDNYKITTTAPNGDTPSFTYNNTTFYVVDSSNNALLPSKTGTSYGTPVINETIKDFNATQTLIEKSFGENSTTTNGGAVYNRSSYSDTTATLEGISGDFIYNTSEGNAGAIYN